MVCVISHNPRQRAVAVIFDPKSERSMPQCQKDCKRVMRSLSASLPVRYRGIKVMFQAQYRMWRRWFQRLADGRGRGAACCVNMLSSPCIVWCVCETTAALRAASSDIRCHHRQQYSDSSSRMSRSDDRAKLWHPEQCPEIAPHGIGSAVSCELLLSFFPLLSVVNAALGKQSFWNALRTQTDRYAESNWIWTKNYF